MKAVSWPSDRQTLPWVSGQHVSMSLELLKDRQIPGITFELKAFRVLRPRPRHLQGSEGKLRLTLAPPRANQDAELG